MSNGKKGGLTHGKSHDQGGVSAIITDTNTPVEIEGGEAIINKEATKKHWKVLSKINQSEGGGVPITKPVGGVAKDGGVVRGEQKNTMPRNGVSFSPKQMDDFTLNISNFLQDSGYFTKINFSKTSFGNSNYIYVKSAPENIENWDSYILKIRISDHGVTNFDRIFNETHILFPYYTDGSQFDPLDFKWIINEIRFKTDRDKYFIKKEIIEEKPTKMEVPEHLLLPTDEVVSSRPSSGRRGSPRVIYNIIRKHNVPLIAWINKETNSTYTTQRMDNGGNVKSELEKGIEVEQEHKDTLEKVASHEITPEEGVAETAKTHIAEDPKYYEKLEGVEGKKNKFKIGEAVRMFDGEPILTITEVNEWADKLPTYDLRSFDQSIIRNNIPENKIFHYSEINEGDEGMLYGQEIVVNWIRDNKVTYSELDENGKVSKSSKYLNIGVDNFKKAFAKFPEEKGKITGVITDLDIAIKDVIHNHPLRKFGNLDFAEAKFLYSLKNETQGIEFRDDETLQEEIMKSLHEMNYIESKEDDFELYILSPSGRQFIEAVDNRGETIKSVKDGVNLFPEEVIIPQDERIYEDLKSCLLEEADDETTFLFEGKTFDYEHNGNKELWKIVSFYKYGANVEHVVKTKLSDKKKNRKLSFDELIKLETDADIHIDGISSVAHLKNCLKLLKKCIDLIDANESHSETKNKLAEKPFNDLPVILEPTVPLEVGAATIDILPSDDHTEAIATLRMLLETEDNAEWKEAIETMEMLAGEKKMELGGVVYNDTKLESFKVALNTYCEERNENKEVQSRAFQLLDEIQSKPEFNTWLTQGSTLNLQELLRGTTYDGSGNSPQSLRDFNAFSLLDTVSMYHEKTQEDIDTEIINEQFGR
jgi:hypothetical protein